MKTLAKVLVVAGFLGFIACGPSAEEKAREAARLDSLRMDSIRKVEEAKQMRIQDSLKAIEMAKQQAIQDSIAAAAAKKGKK